MARYDTLGPALSLGVMGVGLVLGWWLWLESRRQADDLSPDDETHFRRQASRRLLVTISMLLLGLLLFVGTRIPHQIQGRPNLWFVVTWVAVLALVVLLLVLALLDWLATSRYARRHRQAITREGMAILRDELRRRARQRSLRADNDDLATPSVEGGPD